MKPNNRKLENFFISSEYLRSIELSEINATFAAMVECGIAGPPFNDFYITVPIQAVIKMTRNEEIVSLPDDAKDDVFEFEYSEISQPELGVDDITQTSKLAVLNWRGKRSVNYFEVLPIVLKDKPDELKRLVDQLGKFGAALLRVLIVSLATKQVTKTRVPNKLAKLGVGKGRREYRYSYSTTISASHSEGLPISTGEGRSPMRPHLRRGHVRNQHYGPNRELVKKIFIEATFVNTDRDFVSVRDHYNVSLKGTECHAE